MSDLCLIWYCNPVPKNATLKCGFKVCEECVINWIKAEAKPDFIKVGRLNRTIEDAIKKQERNGYTNIIETVKWVNIACQKGNDDGIDDEAPRDIHHRLTYEECNEYIQSSENQHFKDLYAQVLLDITVLNQKSLVRWPRQGWDYIGYINPRRKWGDLLECEKCNYAWNDPSLTPFFKKLRQCWCSWNLNFKIRNDFQKVLRAQAWPGWGISIIKGPGCKHMVWQQCKHEFCWHWLGDYPGYQHRGVLFCPFRIILKVLWYIYIISFTFNLKLAIQYKEYTDFCIDAAEVIGLLLLGNLITLTILFTGCCITLADSFKYPYSSYEYCCRRFGICTSILYPCGWIAGMVCAYIYWPLARRMAYYLMWQWIGIFAIAFITLIVIYSLVWILNVIRRRRERRFYNNYRANQGDMAVMESLLDLPEPYPIGTDAMERVIRIDSQLSPEYDIPVPCDHLGIQEDIETQRPLYLNCEGLSKLFRTESDGDDEEGKENHEQYDEENKSSSSCSKSEPQHLNDSLISDDKENHRDTHLFLAEAHQ